MFGLPQTFLGVRVFFHATTEARKISRAKASRINKAENTEHKRPILAETQ